MAKRIDRRDFIRKVSGTALAGGLIVNDNAKAAVEKHKAKTMIQAKEKKYNIYFGDLHNHCSTGYAKGSIERLYDIAATHLDFLCFTPHSQFPDLENNNLPESVVEHHKKGFEKTKQDWPKCQQLCKDYHKPGKFVTFLGFEWHCSFYGDYCVIMAKDTAPLEYFGLEGLKDYVRKHDAVMIQHHPGYRIGNRGANAKYWDIELSPVLEMISEHGNGDCDTGPIPYYAHSMGGRATENTLQYFLASGKRIGVIGSSDDHLGYPGAYGEGLAVVLAQELTREAIFEAIRARRTYAVSGDRILMDFRLNGQDMGRELAFDRNREIYVDVTGWDHINRIEILKNNKIIHREFPEQVCLSDTGWNEPVIVRLEYGWGLLAGEAVYDWDVEIEVTGGRIVGYMPGFQSGPYEENRRDRINGLTETTLHLESFTSRAQALRGIPTKNVALKLQAEPDTLMTLKLQKPSRMVVKKQLKELVQVNDVSSTTRAWSSPSFIIHRLVFADGYKSRFSITDTEALKNQSVYYVRVIQENGQLAFSSPIWVG